ncbi:hypothetical protein R6Q59_032878 [Mikania micrantha]
MLTCIALAELIDREVRGFRRVLCAAMRRTRRGEEFFHRCHRHGGRMTAGEERSATVTVVLDNRAVVTGRDQQSFLVKC